MGAMNGATSPVSQRSCAGANRPTAWPAAERDGSGPIHSSDVQPVSTAWYNATKGRKQARPDLSGTLPNPSVDRMVAPRTKRVEIPIREWAGRTSNGNMMLAPRSPYTYGFAPSTMISLLVRGLRRALPRKDFVKWLLGLTPTPYNGSYFGRRNLRYKDQPDFRPVPPGHGLRKP